jgi:hypothetical protein
MGYGIQNYDGQKEPIDSAYPDGDIKDNTGSNNGTKNNRKSNADIQQTFVALLQNTGTTSGPNAPNGLPDNAYNGYQYFDALKALFGNNRRIVIKDGPIQSDLVESDYNSIVIIKPTAQNGHIVSMVEPTGSNIGIIGVYNYSAFAVDIYDSGSNDVNGTTPPFSQASGEAIEFQFNSGTNDWEIKKRYLLDL